MARGINDVDALAGFREEFGNTLFRALVPGASHGSGGDGNPPLALLLHMISSGGTIVHLTDPMDHSGVEKNPLGQGGLPGINVRRNPNVPCPLKRDGTKWDGCDFRHDE
jgi:hypothetical protein